MLSIRTQDRMELVPIDSVLDVSLADVKKVQKDFQEKGHNYVIDNEGNYKHCVRYYLKHINEYKVLGTYKTKERALEVLDEIEEVYKLGTSGALTFHNDAIIGEKNIVYQMPKE